MVVIATMNSIEDIWIHPDSGRFWTPVGCIFFVGEGLPIPPVSLIGINVGEILVLL